MTSLLGRRSRGIAIVIPTRLRAGRSGVRIPVEAREVSLFRNVLTASELHPLSYSVGIGFYFQGKSGLGVNLTA
jgi:hypothetical protein